MCFKATLFRPIPLLVVFQNSLMEGQIVLGCFFSQAMFYCLWMCSQDSLHSIENRDKSALFRARR